MHHEITVSKALLQLRSWRSHAFIFLPPQTQRQNASAIFTHGYTSHKGSLLTWGQRLASLGIPTIIFDLPGHYLGSFNEVEDFAEFTEHVHEFFPLALASLELQTKSSSEKIFLGGHSLGGLLALKALELPAFSHLSKTAIAVGLGVGAEGQPHLFETSFYEKTLNLRKQLVSPALSPEVVFPWIFKQKKEITITGQNIHLITGEDDVVVGSDGSERLKNILEKSGNKVNLKKPTHLPHHLPELAATYLSETLKEQL